MREKQIEVLKTCYEYIDKYMNGIDKFTDLVQEDVKEAIDYIPLLIDGIEWIINAITLTKNIYNEEIKLDNLNLKLNEIVEALNNKDYLLLSDLFNYEIKEIVKEIKQKIEKYI